MPHPYLTAYSTDSRTTAYHAGGWEGDEEAGPEGKEEALVLPSLTLVSPSNETLHAQ